MPKKLWKNPFKVVLLGDSTVGKSSIALRYIKKPIENLNATIGASFINKIEQVSDTDSIKLEIWDTAGQERFANVIPLYYRNSYIVIIVYDVSSSNTLNNAEKWVKDIKRNNTVIIPSQTIIPIIILVGNKIDKEKNNKTIENAINLANKMDIIHILTSAKNNENIKQLFKIVAENIYENYILKNTNNHQKSIDILQSTKKTNKCCKT